MYTTGLCLLIKHKQYTLVSAGCLCHTCSKLSYNITIVALETDAFKTQNENKSKTNT